MSCNVNCRYLQINTQLRSSQTYRDSVSEHSFNDVIDDPSHVRAEFRDAASQLPKSTRPTKLTRCELDNGEDAHSCLVNPLQFIMVEKQWSVNVLGDFAFVIKLFI